MVRSGGARARATVAIGALITGALAQAGCATSTSPYPVPSPAPPAPEALTSGPEPTATADALEPECTTLALRGALDAGGARPLTEVDPVGGQLYYDEFTTHACSGSWALVEASRSSGSSFDFWLMREDADGWQIVAISSVRLDTPLDVALFAPESLDGTGADAAALWEALGTTTTTAGRPIFAS